MDRYDIAIIGTGPAGLEAAITARIRNKKVLLLGNKDLSVKVEKAHTIQNYLGLPEVSGEEMQRAFLNHLAQMELSITQDQIKAVYSMGKYFALQGQEAMYEASSLILACGISAEKTLPGESENLGQGVSYCATCDAALYRGRTAIVIGYSKNQEKEAEFLAEIAQQVYYLPLYPSDLTERDRLHILPQAKPLEIRKNDGKMQLVTEKETVEADGIFVLREFMAPSQLVPGLAMDGNHVAVDRSMKTSIAGVFACGDITGTPYQYIKAAGEGNVAALSAVGYLTELQNSSKMSS